MKKTFNYVDSVVVPVAKKDVLKYKKMAKLAAKVWMEHGALDYVECMGDDVPNGKVTSFPMSVKAKKSEIVFISFITYKSKSHRDSVMKKVMDDQRLMDSMSKDGMPFDGMRMFWGGFKPIVKI